MFDQISSKYTEIIKKRILPYLPLYGKPIFYHNELEIWKGYFGNILRSAGSDRIMTGRAESFKYLNLKSK